MKGVRGVSNDGRYLHLGHVALTVDDEATAERLLKRLRAEEVRVTKRYEAMKVSYEERRRVEEERAVVESLVTRLRHVRHVEAVRPEEGCVWCRCEVSMHDHYHRRPSEDGECVVCDAEALKTT